MIMTQPLLRYCIAKDMEKNERTIQRWAAFNDESLVSTKFLKSLRKHVKTDNEFTEPVKP